MSTRGYIKPVACIAATAMVAVMSNGEANAATTTSSSAYGVGANLTVLGILPIDIGPISAASGSAPGPYVSSDTVASLLGAGDLGLVGFKLDTGVLTSAAMSPYPASPVASASATVDNLDVGLGEILLPSILSVGATTLTSDSSVSGIGPLSAIGSSSIENLTISGSALGKVSIDLTGIVDPPANDVLFNAAGLEIIANAQTVSGDGILTKGIQTDALLIEFRNLVLGTGLLNGQIAIAESQANIAETGATGPIPEPSTWVMMIIGVGGVGAMARRKTRSSAEKPA